MVFESILTETAQVEFREPLETVESILTETAQVEFRERESAGYQEFLVAPRNV